MRPNPSLKLTHYGMQRKPGVRRVRPGRMVDKFAGRMVDTVTCFLGKARKSAAC
jgi:hypothetical protein